MPKENLTQVWGSLTEKERQLVYGAIAVFGKQRTLPARDTIFMHDKSKVIAALKQRILLFQGYLNNLPLIADNVTRDAARKDNETAITETEELIMKLEKDA